VINYVLQNDLWFREYVLSYTNAPQLIREDFRDTEDLDGIFSGLNRAGRIYERSSWQYRGESVESMLSEHRIQNTEPQSANTRRISVLREERDFSLQDPLCVFQILKRHYSRYTPEMVASICGCTPEQLVQVARILPQNSGRERTSAICYAVGWTQHTTGCQIIRAAGILQLLLGNAGRPGGGNLALRGHASIQGSTDIPTLYNLLPGYLAQPNTQDRHFTLKDYLDTETPTFGFWHDEPKFLISLLKAWYGDAATPENNFCYDHLPLIDRDYSQLPMLLSIADGEIKGFIVLGQNPAVGGHNAGLVRKGLARLDWMVVRDGYETETASFWYASPEVQAGELDPRRGRVGRPSRGRGRLDGLRGRGPRVSLGHGAHVWKPPAVPLVGAHHERDPEQETPETQPQAYQQTEQNDEQTKARNSANDAGDQVEDNP